MQPAAPVVSYEPTTLTFAETGRLACLYVVVDARSRADVADFLSGWDGCCDVTTIDWQHVRRPASVLVGLELHHRCDSDTGTIRLVFDVRRDREALDRLAATEAIVVGSRQYGAFANTMAAYGVDGNAVRTAIREAEAALHDPVSAGR